MTESAQNTLVDAAQVSREAVVRRAPNGIRYAAFGDNRISDTELERIVQAIPASVAGALERKIYFFVPLAMSESRPDNRADGHPAANEGGAASVAPTLIAPIYTPELSDEAICHRNVTLDGELKGSDGVFISTRLLSDRFALAFELFINVGHAFVDAAGIPESFCELAWNQALADVRGETSHDAWEDRQAALGGSLSGTSGRPSRDAGSPLRIDGKPQVNEKARTAFTESAFADALAIYLLSLAVDFDYSELREREYPLLAPQALAERLRAVNKLFPPNSGYEFAIRYRRRA